MRRIFRSISRISDTQYQAFSAASLLASTPATCCFTLLQTKRSGFTNGILGCQLSDSKPLLNRF